QRPRWLIPVIVAALVIVVFGGIAGVINAIGQRALQAPMDTATTFCNDLRAQKYTDAYSLLSSGYQAQITGKDFTAFSQVHDQLDGKVRQCGLAGLQNNAGFNLNLNPQSASFNAQITRNRSYTGEVSLVNQNGSWKIDSVDDSLQGSDVGGLATGSQFCQALAAQDYAAVYAMFTPAYQQQIGSAENYANGLKAVFGDGQFQITGCQPQIDTYTVTAQDDAASVSGAFDIKVTTDAGALTVQVPFKIAFAKISGAWKISDLEVVQSQG
ncbi:MAG: nuclear transport factor 2 family protein, partial [Candidatus Angelobacter sp.]